MVPVHLNAPRCLSKELFFPGLAAGLLNFRDFFRNYGSRPKLITEINSDVSDSIERGDYKPKRHVGIIKNITTTLPQAIIDNIRASIKDQPVKALAEDGIKLNRYLHSRHLPYEEEELRSKYEDAALWVERKYNITSLDLTEEERQGFRERSQNQIRNILKKKSYMWKAVDYNDYQSKVYLVGRSSADYAALNRVFKEMSIRLSDFKPRTLFDFGSGVGTVTWAAKQFWEESLHEYFCVDSSVAMNDLSSLVLNGGQSVENSGKGFFYRQFLPVSHALKYDLVVSAFSLFELPSLKSRLETILTLWKKTQGYLVIIEQGTNAGFQVINEARDFILEFCNNQNPSEPTAHVFAPCPHDSRCPRFTEDYTPCNFEAPYLNPFYPSTGVLRERFSYLVLKKGIRSKGDPQWPRVVRPVLPRARHVVCRMCTPTGKLQEIVFSAAKHGKVTYKCARASRWGDLLPITIKETEPHCISQSETEHSVEKDQT